MKGCTIRQEQRDTFDILHLNGSLDAYSFSQLEDTLNELRDQDLNRVVLNCEKLEYISSAALGALIGFSRRARERHGDMKLAAVSAKIRSIIELLGFDKILELVDDVDTATSSFAN